MYRIIQNNIDASTQAANKAETEEERMLLIGDVRYWESKKVEYMNTHTIGEVNHGE